ncbi:hypothetical protein E5676_scaffold260G00270 [Cucumis melo var. makuwa]|uniref:Uncharacterized protein n=1 Tax=Cucumis melo var. makuwa TaxID=1194695 RepID=A0A5D3DU53_CUCMM|nr:hypothetical protein E6C27_scaffold261G00280 [Cucumis melo var. makuwa]TYK26835.1 hypothetical protein E5676_scaffold260G00270 [Cucumis melo var. makuwa]
MIRVIRQDRSQPDCLSVSSGYTTDQFILGVPLGSAKTNYVPPGSHVVRVRERASSWVPLFRTLMESEGKGRRKLASDKEGSVTCHMGTQFRFRVYLCSVLNNCFNHDFGAVRGWFSHQRKTLEFRRQQHRAFLTAFDSIRVGRGFAAGSNVSMSIGVGFSQLSRV